MVQDLLLDGYLGFRIQFDNREQREKNVQYFFNAGVKKAE